MRYLIICLILTIYLPTTAQQTNYFNYNYPLEWQYDANSMVIIDSTYYLSGNIARTTEDCPYWLMGYHITAINALGVHDTTVIFDKCEQETYIGWKNSMFISNNKIIINGLKNIEDSINSIFVLTLNQDFDTLQNINILNDTLMKRSYSCTSFENEILICGSTDSTYGPYSSLPDTSYTKGTIIKLNFNGSIDWLRSYSWNNINDGCYSSFRQILKSVTYDIYLIGVSNDFSSNVKNIILKTDSLGNEEWVHAYGSNTYSNPRFTDIIETRDSCILVCGAYTYGETYGGLYPYDGWLIKLNPDGSTVWNRKFRDSINSGSSNDFYAYYKAITEKENGEIIATLKTKSDINGEYIGNKFRLRCHYPNGDIKWDKVIDSIGGSTGSFEPTSIALDENENIIISGYGDIYYLDVNDDWTYDQRIFLIKTDSLGNDHFVSVSEPQAKPITRYKLVVYPNPVSDYLFIEINENAQANGELTIVNQSGQIVYQNHVTNDAFSSGICVSDFTHGHYLIQLKTENKTFFGKFVKY